MYLALYYYKKIKTQKNVSRKYYNLLLLLLILQMKKQKKDITLQKIFFILYNRKMLKS